MKRENVEHWLRILYNLPRIRASVEEETSLGEDYYRELRNERNTKKLDNNVEMNLDDCHVSSFVPAATGKRGPEIRAGPIPLRPGKNVRDGISFNGIPPSDSRPAICQLHSNFANS